MAVIEHPLGGLIQGMIEGHQLARQLQQEADAHQAFLTQQALHNQEMSFNDIQRTMDLMSRGARPVVNGMVQEPATTVPGMQPMPGGEGLPTPGPQQVPGILRKPGGDGRFTVSLTDSQGNKRQYEMPSPEEQLARQMQLMTSTEMAQAVGKARAAEQARHEMLAQSGVVLDPRLGSILGLPPGTKVLDSEIPGLLQEAQKIRNANQFTQKPAEIRYEQAPILGAPQPGQPGQQPQYDFSDLQQAGAVQGPPGLAARWQSLLTRQRPTTAPPAAQGGIPGTPGLPQAPGATTTPATGPRVIATGGTPEPTGEFGAYLRASAMKKGYTLQNAPPDVIIQATNDYAQKAKTPEDQEQIRAMRNLAMQLTQAHIDDLQTRRSAAGSTPMPITPGTREYKIAQDLAYGRITMPQFRSLTAYSRDTNKKMDIYDKAAELNPNFNPAQFEMGYTLAKNPKVQQQLASMDNVKQGIPDLLKFSDAAARSGAPMLNKFIQKGGFAVGGRHYSDFRTAQTAFADELSGALGFGSATDMSRQMGVDMTNPNMSPEQFTSAVTNVIEPFIQRKRSTLLNQMGVYGQPGMNPAAAPAPTASGPAPVEHWDFDASGKLVKR